MVHLRWVLIKLLLGFLTYYVLSVIALNCSSCSRREEIIISLTHLLLIIMKSLRDLWVWNWLAVNKLLLILILPHQRLLPHFHHIFSVIYLSTSGWSIEIIVQLNRILHRRLIVTGPSTHHKHLLIEYILFGLIYRETIYVCPSCIAMCYLNLSARTSCYIWLVLIETVPSGVTVITSRCFKKLNFLVETFVASTYLPLICHLILQEIHLLSLIIVIWHLVIHLVVLILK